MTRCLLHICPFTSTVTAGASLRVQSHHTFLEQRHGSGSLLLSVVFVLHTYKVLQQLGEIDVLVADVALFCFLVGRHAPVTHGTPT
jgi:hypothetical protein